MNDRVVIGCSISAIAVVLISIWVWNSKYNHNNSRKKQPKSDPQSKQLSNAQNSRPLASSIPNSAMENKMISSNDQCEEKDSIKKNLSSDTSERSTKENVAESDEIQNDDISGNDFNHSIGIALIVFSIFILAFKIYLVFNKMKFSIQLKLIQSSIKILIEQNYLLIQRMQSIQLPKTFKVKENSAAV